MSEERGVLEGREATTRSEREYPPTPPCLFDDDLLEAATETLRPAR